MEVRIRSKISAQEVFRRIGEGMDPPDFGWSLSGFAGQKMFIGTAGLEDDTVGFLLFRRRYGAGYLPPCSVSPFLYGEVRPCQDGSEVLGVLTLYPFTKVVIALLLSSGFVGAAFCAWLGATLIGWVASLAAAALGGAMLGLARRFAHADSPVIRRYLATCAGEHVADTPPI